MDPGLTRVSSGCGDLSKHASMPGARGLRGYLRLRAVVAAAAHEAPVAVHLRHALQNQQTDECLIWKQPAQRQPYTGARECCAGTPTVLRAPRSVLSSIVTTIVQMHDCRTGEETAVHSYR